MVSNHSISSKQREFQFSISAYLCIMRFLLQITECPNVSYVRLMLNQYYWCDRFNFDKTVFCFASIAMTNSNSRESGGGDNNNNLSKYVQIKYGSVIKKNKGVVFSSVFSFQFLFVCLFVGCSDLGKTQHQLALYFQFNVLNKNERTSSNIIVRVFLSMKHI